MNYAQIRHYDTANGKGIRTSLFVCGCTHNCYNCFNKEYQNFSYGSRFTKNEESQILSYLEENEVCGLTIIGGEPLQQDVQEICSFLEKARKICDKLGKNIWIYSGYTYEEIIADKDMSKILSYCDILVDGRFEESLKNLRLKFRGSSNQKIIDVQKSIKLGEIIDISNEI